MVSPWDCLTSVAVTIVWADQLEIPHKDHNGNVEATQNRQETTLTQTHKERGKQFTAITWSKKVKHMSRKGQNEQKGQINQKGHLKGQNSKSTISSYQFAYMTINTQYDVGPVCVPMELLSTYFNLPQPSVMLIQCVSPRSYCQPTSTCLNPV